MTQISVISKESHTLLNQVDSNNVSLTENSVVVIKAPKEDVASITRNGDSAIINLKNGETIVVENYFNTASSDNSLVFEGQDGSLYWAKFTDSTGAIADVIQYQPLAEIEPLLYKDSLTGVILPWALGAGGAGLIGAAASNGSDKNDEGTPAPAAPAKLSAFEVSDNQAPQVGKIAAGSATNDKTPAVSGSGAEAGAEIKIYDGAQLIASTTAKADGTWSVEVAQDLADGVHSITVSQTVNGIEGPKSDAFDFTVDTKNPNVSIDDLGETNENQPVISGKTNEPKAEIDVVIKDGNGDVVDRGKGTVDSSGNWIYTPGAALPEGAYTVEVTAKDPAGNTSSVDKGGLVVDTTDPTVTIDPLKPTAENTPTIGGTTDPNSVVDVVIKDKGGNIVDSGTGTVDGHGDWTYTPKNPLPEGEYEVEVKATDPAGNESTATGGGLDVDTTSPAVSIDPLKPSNNTAPTITGKTEQDSTVSVQVKDHNGNVVDAGPATVDSAGNWTYTPAAALPEGAYTVEATAKDPAGNTGTAKDSGLSIDTTNPTISINPLSPTADTTPDFGGQTDKDATVTVRIKNVSGTVVETGTAVVDHAGKWSYTAKMPLADGSYAVEATAKDPAGNTANAQASGLIVDTALPTVTVDAQALTNDATPDITGTTDKGALVTVTVKNAAGQIVDSGIAIVDSKGDWSYTPALLADGTYTVEAVAQNPAGNKAAASANGLTVDTVPPAVTIEPLVLTKENIPVIKGTSEAGATVNVVVKDASGAVAATGTVSVDQNNEWTFTPAAKLADGAYSVVATAQDPAGNTSNAVTDSGLQVDTVPPTVDIDNLFGAAAARMLMSTSSTTAATLPQTNQIKPTFSGSSTKSIEVMIYLQDEAGKMVDSGPAILDTATGRWSYTPSHDLAEGYYMLQAISKDAAGNQSQPAAKAFIIDIQEPIVEVEEIGLSNDATPDVKGKVNEPTSTVTVKVKDASGAVVETGTATVAADGKWTYTVKKVLADGNYEVTASAKDKAGNISVEDTATAQIDTAAPSSTLTVSATGEVLITFSESVKGFDASDVTVQGGKLTQLTQQLDGSWKGQVVADGTSGAAGKVTVAVADGAYTDLAGNNGKGASATDVSVPSVDTTAPNAVITIDANGAVTVSFSEAVKGFDPSDVKATGGKLQSLTEQADGSWKGQVIADGVTGASGKVELKISAGSYTDLAGNAGTSATQSQNVPSIDSTGPIPTLTLDVNGNLSISFSEAVKGFDASDVKVAGGKIISLTPQADGSWTGVVVALGSTGASSNVVVSIDAGTYTDLAGNAGLSGFAVAELHSLDTTVPTAQMTLDVNGNLVIKFSEAVKGFDVGDLTVTNGSLSNLVEQTDGSWKAKITPNSNTGAPEQVTVILADQSYEDLAGNKGVAAQVQQSLQTVDTLAPVIDGLKVQPNTDGTATVTGKTEAGATVTVKDPNGKDVPVTVHPDGAFTATVPAPAAEGTYNASATDKAGNTGTAQDILVDKVAPVVTVDVVANSDGTATVTGKTEAGATVTVKDPSGKDVPVTVNSDGSYTATVPAPAAEGVYTASATDKAGNIGTGSDTLVDKVAPVVTVDVVANPDGTATVTGKTEAGATVTVKDPSGKDVPVTVNLDGSYTATVPAPAAEGTYTAAAKDKAGNVGTGTDVLDDNIGPSVNLSFDVNGNLIINFSEPVTGFDISDIKIVGGSAVGLTKVSDTQWTAQIKGDTAAAVQYLEVSIADNSYTDIAGNFGLGGVVKGNITLPTVDIDDIFGTASFAAPAMLFAARTLTAVLPPATNNPLQTFSGTSTKSVEVKVNIYDSTNRLLDSGLAKLDPLTGKWTYTPSKALPDGLLTLEAIGIDALGVQSAPSYKEFIIDTVKPDIDIDQVGLTTDATPSFGGKTEAGATITVTIKDKAGNVVETGTAVVDFDGEWNYTAKSTADGSYTVEATAKDRAGNISDKAATSLIVDTVSQLDGLTVTANPDGTATVTGKAETGATVTVKDPNGNDVPVTVNPDGTFTATVPAPAAEGTYKAAATDKAGNAGTATADLDDHIAPKIDGFNVDSQADGTVAISGKTEAGATVTVKDPNGKDVPVTVNPDGSFTATVPAPAAEGTYKATATDKAGNNGYAQDDLIDTTVPSILTAEVNQADGATVFGQAQAGADITVYKTDGKTVLGQGKADASGQYSVYLNPAQVDGEKVKVTAKDPGGESAPISAAAPDLYAPEAPIAQVSADGKAVTGTTEPNADITVYGGSKGTTVIATAKADANGNYSAALNPALVDGEDVKVTAKDPGGESSATPAQAPDLYAPNAPTAVFNSAGNTISGDAEANSVIKVYAPDGVTVIAQGASDANGKYSIKLPSAHNDGQTLLVSAKDGGGESGKTGAKAPNVQLDAADNLVSAGINFEYPVTDTRSAKLFSDFSLANIGTKTYTGYFTVGDQELGKAIISVSTGSLLNLFDSAQMKLYAQNADGSWKLIGGNKDAGLLDLLGIFGESTKVVANNLQTGNYKFEFTGGSLIGLMTSIHASLDLSISSTTSTPVVSSVTEARGNVVTDNDSIYGKDNVPAGTQVTAVNGQSLNAAGSTVIAGDHGVLTIAKDGTYSYKPNSTVSNIGKADVFSYTVTDPSTGKTSTADLTIHINTQSELSLKWNTAHPADDATTVVATDNSNSISFDASNAISTAKASAISYSWLFGVGNTKTGSSKFTVADGTFEDVKISFGSTQVASLLGGTVINVYDKANKLVATTSASTLIDVITLLPNGNSLSISGLKAGAYTIQAVTNTGLSFAGSVNATISRTITDLDDFTAKFTGTTAKGNIFTDNNGSGTDVLASNYTGLYISKDGGVTYTAVNKTGITVQGDHGQLLIKSDGSYSYSVTDGKAVTGQVEDFSYKLVAPNGDTSIASLTISSGLNYIGSVGDDKLTSSSGNDTVTSKVGADTLIFKVLNNSDAAGGNGHDTWNDFKKAEGDKIDVSALLQGKNVDQSNIGEFISVSADGKGNTIISIDRDGTAGKAFNKVELLTLKNTDIGLQELLDNNHLVY